MKVLFLYSNQNRYLLPVPPVGLGYVATATRRAGHEVRFLDMLMARRPLEKLGEELRSFRPEVIAVSVRNIDSTLMQDQGWEVERIGRELMPALRRDSKAPVILGGPAISILGPEVFRTIPADYAILGEGEQALPELLEQLASGTPPAGPGLLVSGQDAPSSTGIRRLSEFSGSGLEDWIDWRAYERGGGTWALQTKRGCPMSCIYCSYPQIEGRHTRFRDPRDVVDEIERVTERCGPRTFEFIDSTFNLPPSHAISVCEEIIRRRLKVRLAAMGLHPAGLTRELLDAMREAGFVAMMITPETVSPLMLEKLGKGFTVEQVEQAVELARDSRIASAWFFLLGGPGETMETVEQSVRFAEKRLDWRNCLAIFMTGLRILPHTQLAEIATREGVLEPGQTFSRPLYYLSPGVTEGAIIRRLNQASRRNPGIVQAAEEGKSRSERLFYQILRLVRAAPPRWRFLPRFLRAQPIAFLRGRFPLINPGHGEPVAGSAGP